MDNRQRTVRNAMRRTLDTILTDLQNSNDRNTPTARRLIQAGMALRNLLQQNNSELNILSLTVPRAMAEFQAAHWAWQTERVMGLRRRHMANMNTVRRRLNFNTPNYPQYRNQPGPSTWMNQTAVKINFPNRLLNNIEPLSQNRYQTNRNYAEVRENGRNFYFNFNDFLRWYRQSRTNPLTRKRVNNARKVQFVLTPTQQERRNRAARVIQRAFRRRRSLPM